MNQKEALFALGGILFGWGCSLYYFKKCQELNVKAQEEARRAEQPPEGEVKEAIDRLKETIEQLCNVVELNVKAQEEARRAEQPPEGEVKEAFDRLKETIEQLCRERGINPGETSPR